MAIPDLQTIVINIPGVVIGFAFHEFAHAITATWFGDSTAKNLGRVTLNPLSHLDPLGTLLLLLGGFGWAKPVPVDVDRLRPRVIGDIVVSLAGVTMNFLLAIFFGILAGFAYAGFIPWQSETLGLVLERTARINTILVGFNLLPIPPLDGFRVVRYLLPAGSNELVMRLYRIGPFLLLLLFWTDIIDLGPVYRFLWGTVEQAVIRVLSTLL